MHIEDYLPDDDSSVIENLESSTYSSASLNDEDFYDDDGSFIDEMMSDYHQGNNHPSFGGRDTLPTNANSDGYIPDGKQELTTTISDIHKTFKLYSKGGHKYVLYNGSYYQIDGSGTVTIGGVKYNKIG